MALSRQRRSHRSVLAASCPYPVRISAVFLGVFSRSGAPARPPSSRVDREEPPAIFRPLRDTGLWAVPCECPCGGIGRRARLKIEFRKECWFDSGQGHQKLFRSNPQPSLKASLGLRLGHFLVRRPPHVSAD